MRREVIPDTGPLVALLNSRDRYHLWSAQLFRQIEPPLHTCEAVLVEAAHLLRRQPGGMTKLLDFVRRGVLVLPFSLEAEAEGVQRLQARFADTPMSLADACLVRMAEMTRGSKVLTIDSDFEIYRMHGSRPIPSILPERR